jgi:uncharacterized membrane protein YtjA (UPF0391 family)
VDSSPLVAVVAMERYTGSDTDARRNGATMIALDTLIYAVLYLIVGGLIFWLLEWLLGYVGVPEPFHKIARVVLAVAAVLFVISVLLWLIGFPLVRVGRP